MCAQIINGKAIAAEVYKELDEKVSRLRQRGIRPRAAIVLLGSEEMSARYVSLKEQAAVKHGMECITYHLSEETTQEELISLLDRLNADSTVHGIIVQMPLPDTMDTTLVLDAIDPAKDIDGLHFCNAGKLLNDTPAIVACTPRAIMRLIDSTGVDITSKHIVVVGRSNLVGRPIAICLLNRNATVSVCHTKTNSLGSITATADILVVAAGRAGLITADMVKEGAIVIDVGQTNIDGKLYGDVKFDEVEPKASYITKVTGGVGPMTVAMLMTNLAECAERM